MSVVRLAALLVAVLLLAGCASGSAATNQPVATLQVEMPPSYRFEPSVIEVPVGATVTFHNSDNFTHSVELLDGSGRDPIVRPGESATITFDQPGEYDYTCRFHRTEMSGKVIVVAK